MLAEARHDEPLPADVAARLDAALAGLQGGSVAGEGSEGQVVPLRPDPGTERSDDEARTRSRDHRWRRRTARVLLAAAAVVAIGWGTTQVLPNVTQSGGSSDSGSAQDSAQDSADAPTESGGDSRALAETPSPVTDLGIAGLRPVDPDGLDRDLARLRGLSTRSQPKAEDAISDMVRCGPADPEPGSRFVGAAYDGRPALVVYHPVRGDEQQVDLFLCDTARPRQVFRTVTLTP
jgi:hypothetical protein